MKPALMQVLTKQCDTCIFKRGNLMYLRPGRVTAMVQQCREQQSFIPCHETLVYDDEDEYGESTATGPMCRGFYEAHRHVSQLFRIAELLDAVEFVDLASADGSAHSHVRPDRRDAVSGSQPEGSRRSGD